MNTTRRATLWREGGGEKGVRESRTATGPRTCHAEVGRHRRYNITIYYLVVSPPPSCGVLLSAMLPYYHISVLYHLTVLPSYRIYYRILPYYRNTILPSYYSSTILPS